VFVKLVVPRPFAEAWIARGDAQPLTETRGQDTLAVLSVVVALAADSTSVVAAVTSFGSLLRDLLPFARADDRTISIEANGGGIELALSIDRSSPLAAETAAVVLEALAQKLRG
jgi:hypothetical protein